jgi:flagellar basal body P-ring formation protein FlgA
MKRLALAVVVALAASVGLAASPSRAADPVSLDGTDAAQPVPTMEQPAQTQTAHLTPLPQQQAQLRLSAMIEGDTIKLGDLWDNLGAKAGTVIANAPLPGRRVSLDARWLYAVAAANGIDWRPSSAYQHVMVERAGQSIDQALIETQLREALTMNGLPEGTNFEINNRSALNIMIPADAQPTVAVRDVVIDPRTQRFSATIEAPAGSPNAVRTQVVGHLFATTRIPVLNHAMARGDVITAHDIDWQQVREESVRRDIVIEPRQLIGMEPRYQIRQDTPIRLTDVERPILVARNSTVTMILRTPYMTLTAQGTAMSDGGQGDIIKVTNLQTKQVVEGRVESQGTVAVAFGGPYELTN